MIELDAPKRVPGKFEVGDRVSTLEHPDADGHTVKIGTVVAVHEFSVVVDFYPDCRGIGHTCNGRIQTQTGWNISHSELKLVD